jgi:hypothetical protein
VVRPRQLKLFEKAEPGASVQLDVKVVKVGGRKAFQYTAIDDCTRYRLLRLYRRQNQWSSWTSWPNCDGASHFRSASCSLTTARIPARFRVDGSRSWDSTPLHQTSET